MSRSQRIVLVTTWRCEFTALAEASADCRPVTRGGHETSFMIPLSTLSAGLIKLTTDGYCQSVCKTTRSVSYRGITFISILMITKR